MLLMLLMLKGPKPMSNLTTASRVVNTQQFVGHIYLLISLLYFTILFLKQLFIVMLFQNMQGS